MKKRIGTTLLMALGFLLNTTAFSSSADLFAITASGTVTTLDIQLCLNGNTPWSCEKHTVTRDTLSIRTTIPNHTYTAIGIKVLTPGYTLTGCQMISNGYCLFSASNTAATTITATSTTATTTLTPSVATLGLSVDGRTLNTALTGRARVITITNGANSATGVSVEATGLPTGTNITDVPTTCTGTLAPNATCTVTVTPGASATSNCGTGIAPTAGAVVVSANNADSATTNVVVLTYGCIYQGGYIYSVNDITDNTGSIGGKVATQTDQADSFPSGIIWSSDGTEGQVKYDDITGIYQDSTAGVNSCNGKSDGSCNSSRILNFYTPTTTYPLAYYAAGLCAVEISGYSGWYLPAICELGYDTNTIGSGCGTALAPAIQNMQSNLVDNNGIGALAGYYWGSTEDSGRRASGAWVQFFAVGGGSGQYGANKVSLLGVRCSRALTL